MVCEVSIFTPKVLFPIISQAQKFNNSVFLAFSRQLGITRKSELTYIQFVHLPLNSRQ